MHYVILTNACTSKPYYAPTMHAATQLRRVAAAKGSQQELCHAGALQSVLLPGPCKCHQVYMAAVGLTHCLMLTRFLWMQQRDPGRSFVLGERLQYVLLPGLRTQDEAAEDPLTAVLAGQQADFELYWKNKMLRPLSEMFAVCLNPAQLHTLLSGSPHHLSSFILLHLQLCM